MMRLTFCVPHAIGLSLTTTERNDRAVEAFMEWGDGNAVAEGGRGKLLAAEHFLDIAGAAQACLGELLCKRLYHGSLVCG